MLSVDGKKHLASYTSNAYDQAYNEPVRRAKIILDYIRVNKVCPTNTSCAVHDIDVVSDPVTLITPNHNVKFYLKSGYGTTGKYTYNISTLN